VRATMDRHVRRADKDADRRNPQGQE